MGMMGLMRRAQFHEHAVHQHEFRMPLCTRKIGMPDSLAC
jgi:hypothetical protein